MWLLFLIEMGIINGCYAYELSWLLSYWKYIDIQYKHEGIGVWLVNADTLQSLYHVWQYKITVKIILYLELPARTVSNARRYVWGAVQYDTVPRGAA